jgi:ribonuclease VapC
MIAVDASALVAILLDEPEAERFTAILEDHERAFVCPISVYETVAALVRELSCSVIDARASVSDFLDDAGIAIASISPSDNELALNAFDRYGKGRNPASLNMGDCYSYALAKSLRVPLLYKGNDFSRTDLDSAA